MPSLETCQYYINNPQTITSDILNTPDECGHTLLFEIAKDHAYLLKPKTSLDYVWTMLGNGNGILEQATSLGLNSVITRGELKGTSALYFMLLHLDSNVFFHNCVIGLINAQGLNSVIASNGNHENISVLHLILCMYGISTLTKHSHLIPLINQQGLLTTCNNDAKNALYCLVNKPHGREFLAHNPHLIDMITPELLNQPYGEDTPLLRWLTCDDTGLDILLAHEPLIHAICKEGLCHMSVSYDNTSCALLILAESVKGQQVLAKIPNLVDKVTIEAITNLFYYESLALEWLLDNDIGHHILYTAVATTYIPEAWLVNFLEKGDNSPSFVAHFMAQSPIGKRFLHENPRLNKYIFSKRVSYDQAPLLLPATLCSLADDEFGLSVLLDNAKHLLSFDKADLNQVVELLDMRNSHFFAELSYSDLGLHIMQRYPQLLEKLTPDSLNNPIDLTQTLKAPMLWYLIDEAIDLWVERPQESLRPVVFTKNFVDTISEQGLLFTPDSAPYQGISALSLLMIRLHKNPECYAQLLRYLVSTMPSLLSAINENTLNDVISSSPDTSVLWHLSLSSEGISLLVDTSLIHAITAEGLLRPRAGTSNRTALYNFIANKRLDLFTQYPKLWSFLDASSMNLLVFDKSLQSHSTAFCHFCDNSKLLSQLTTFPSILDAITQDTLNYAYDDVFAISPLLSLCATDTGLSVLHEYPDLVKKINDDGFNRQASRGRYQGSSPVSLLVNTQGGRSLFATYPFLLERINTQGVMQLLTMKTGQAFVCEHPILLDSIAQGTKLSDFFDVTMLSDFLSSEHGIRIVNMRKDFLCLIDSVLLNGYFTDDYDTVQTFLYRLVSDSTDVSVVEEHLLSNINEQGVISLLFSSKTRAFLAKHAELLTLLTSTGLNTANKDAPFDNRSVLWHLLKDDEGQAFMSAHPHIVKLICAEGLCPNEHQEMPLYFLLQHALGLSILQEHPFLLGLIEPVVFNRTMDFGTHQGKSFVQVLLSDPECKRLIYDNPPLLKKMDEQGLEHLFSTEEGATFAFQFSGYINSFSLEHVKKLALCNAFRRMGFLRELLDNDNAQEVLHSSSFFEALLVHTEAGFFAHLQTKYGAAYITKHPNNLFHITNNGLNSKSLYDDGLPALGHLASSTFGRSFLMEHQATLNIVSPEGLNSRAETGAYKNLSALWFFAKEVEWHEVLFAQKNLLQCITKDGLNHFNGIDDSRSALWYFADNLMGHGGDILSLSHIQEKITQEGLCKKVLCFLPNSSETTFKSALWLLSSSVVGRRIIANSTHIVSCISSHAFTSHQRAGPDESTSVFWLLTSSVEGIKILRGNLCLREMIDQTSLNLAPLRGEHMGKSPFWHLSSHAVGIWFLHENPALVDLVTNETLFICPGYNNDSSAVLHLAQCDLGVEVILRSKTLVAFIMQVADDVTSPYYAEFTQVRRHLLSSAVEKVMTKYQQRDYVNALKSCLEREEPLLSENSWFSKSSYLDNADSGYHSDFSSNSSI